jgi:hypothetical protein
MPFPVHPLSVLPDYHIILLSNQQDKNNTENILNPIGGTDALVYIQGARSWTLHTIASTLDIQFTCTMLQVLELTCGTRWKVLHTIENHYSSIKKKLASK